MTTAKPPVKNTPKPAAKPAPKSEQAAAAVKNQPKVETGIQSAGDVSKGATPPANPDLDMAKRPAPVEDVDKGITQRSDVAPQDHEKTLNSDTDPETKERQKAGKHAAAATQTKESKTIEDETRRVANLTNEQREALRDDIRNHERDETGVKIKGPIHRIGDNPDDVADDGSGPANSQDAIVTEKEKKS